MSNEPKAEYAVHLAIARGDLSLPNEQLFSKYIGPALTAMKEKDLHPSIGLHIHLVVED